MRSDVARLTVGKRICIGLLHSSKLQLKKYRYRGTRRNRTFVSIRYECRDCDVISLSLTERVGGAAMLRSARSGLRAAVVARVYERADVCPLYTFK